MATIDLIVLGILRKESLSAYDIQKLVEYRQISEWVKISTPSIYKKVLQLEEKGYIKGNIVKEGNMPKKAVYSLTNSGLKEFEKLMTDISSKPINMFLDFNAVVVNLLSLKHDEQMLCLTNIEKNLKISKQALEDNIKQKENIKEIPEMGMAVLYEQYALAESLEKWLVSLKNKISNYW